MKSGGTQITRRWILKRLTFYIMRSSSGVFHQPSFPVFHFRFNLHEHLRHSVLYQRLPIHLCFSEVGCRKTVQPWQYHGKAIHHNSQGIFLALTKEMSSLNVLQYWSHTCVCDKGLFKQIIKIIYKWIWIQTFSLLCFTSSVTCEIPSVSW